MPPRGRCQLVCSLLGGAALVAGTGEHYMPDEGEPHTRTWMAFGAHVDIWGEGLLDRVRGDICRVATAIAKYEPVSLLVRKDEMEIAKSKCGDGVTFVEATMNDIWMRDTGPVFVNNTNDTVSGIKFNFNGWGEKQTHALDNKVADFVATQANVPLIVSNMILEGGGIEVDGDGTAIITESCVLNDNRNPGWTKAQAEAELMPLLGLDKIIWLPGVKGADITDGHTDFYARFARPGVIFAHFDPDTLSPDHTVTQTHLNMLQGMKDAKGRTLEVHVLNAPSWDKLRYSGNKDSFAGGYVNFYVANGAVIAPEFGDATADKAAADKLQELFPERKIVAINIDGIAAGGGGIHCTTQQQPAFGKEPGKPTGTTSGQTSAGSSAITPAWALISGLVAQVLLLWQ